MKRNETENNIFKELGFKNPEEWLAKAELARQINKLIEKKNLTQHDAAKLLGINQPKISALKTGKLSIFSLESLFRYLNILGQQITIKLTPKTRSKKKASINVQIQTQENSNIAQKENAVYAKSKK